MHQPSHSFEHQLRQTIALLDQELEQLAQIDERLRSHLTHSKPSAPSTEDDSINQLLSLVKSKAQTLHFYRELNFFSKKSLSVKEHDIVLSRSVIQELLIKHEAQLKRDPWQSIQLDLQPPYVVEQQGVSVGITNLELSSQTIRIAFTVEGSIPLGEVAGQEDIPISTNEWSDPLPVLTGIQLQDDTGTTYTVETPPFFQLPHGKKRQWQLNSYLTFLGTVPQQIQSLHLGIRSFFFLPAQVFLVLEKEPLIIQGSWRFTFVRRSE